jgi:predicted MFS family arabinose efflux permease
MPDGIKPPALSMAAWRETLHSKGLMLCVGVTLLLSAGQFVLFSYFAPYYKATLQVTPGQLSLLFAWFGAFGFIGNIVMSRNIDRLGAPAAVMWGAGAMALSLLLWPLGTSLVLAALVTVPWALGCFSSNSAQQARLVGLAPALASGSIALNTSAMYAGQALGGQRRLADCTPGHGVAALVWPGRAAGGDGVELVGLTPIGFAFRKIEHYTIHSYLFNMDAGYRPFL